MTSLAGFRKYFEDATRSMKPEEDKKNDDKGDYLDGLDDELSIDWKKNLTKDQIIIQQPIEMGNFVYKTSAWKVLNANDSIVTIQLDTKTYPNLRNNVFLRKPGGKLSRLDAHTNFDDHIYPISRKQYAQMLDASMRGQTQQAGGGPPGMGGPEIPAPMPGM